MLIFLIGLWERGKSHLGRGLQSFLKYKFIDTDELIEKKARRINTIFLRTKEMTISGSLKKSIERIIKEEKQSFAQEAECPVILTTWMEWMKMASRYLRQPMAFYFHRLVAEKKDRPLIKISAILNDGVYHGDSRKQKSILWAIKN